MVAPTIGAVMPGLCSSHASATCAGATPRSPATSPTRSTTSKSLARCRGSRRTASVSARVVSALAVAGAVAGQHAAGERAPRDDADALVDAQRDHLALLLAVEEVVVVLHRDEARASRGARRRAAPWRTARRTCCWRRCSAPCRPARRRGAPPSSPRSACSGPSGGSGRGRRSRAPSRRSDASIAERMCLRESPPPFGPGVIGMKTLVAITASSRRRNLRTQASGRDLARAVGVDVGGVEEVDARLDRGADDRLGCRPRRAPTAGRCRCRSSSSRGTRARRAGRSRRV